jgi:hypothetical protein
VTGSASQQTNAVRLDPAWAMSVGSTSSSTSGVGQAGVEARNAPAATVATPAVRSSPRTALPGASMTRLAVPSNANPNTMTAAEGAPWAASPLT